jgi:hypothetical protein
MASSSYGVWILDQRQQKLIHLLALLQARYEGNRLLY